MIFAILFFKMGNAFKLVENIEFLKLTEVKKI